MKHHFGDMLDRDGDYWTIVPNRERYAYRIGNLPERDEAVEILTIGKGDAGWERVFEFPNLVELTLHEPSQDQLQVILRLPHLARLRITHARPKNLEFLSESVNVGELVLEYVSGFSDLSPLRQLRQLKSLHLENLRRVSDFSGLAGISSLRYLHIDGTLDWKQPIDNFEFLSELPNLEVLSFFQVISKASYPVFLPALRLKNLKKLKLGPNMFSAEEYALLEVGLEGVAGAVWEPCRRFGYSRIPLPQNDPRARLSDEELQAKHPEVFIDYQGKRSINDPDNEWFEFVGKGAGRVKSTSPQAAGKCAEYERQYAELKTAARDLLTGVND